ncbi:MAG TPA: hypothetical protein VD866_08875 [Urbifossiella sp.]|nr:hypothetical protein [Urbifossiella sp.]
MKLALAAFLAVALTATAIRADIRRPVPPPPPPPPPTTDTVAQVVAGSALGFAVMGLGLWLARRNRQVVAA